MKLNNPTGTVLYTIEEASKVYRKFCQRNIDAVEADITVDQALILIIISQQPDLTQMEMADLAFKDYASLTRILQLMVKKGYLLKKENENDRRRSILEITDKGQRAIKDLSPVILYNRSAALDGIQADELQQFAQTLQKIIANCKK